MEFTVSQERILEAAKTSVEAKKALKALFPEVFDHPKYIKIGSVFVKKNTEGIYALMKKGGVVKIYNINYSYSWIRQLEINSLQDKDKEYLSKSEFEYMLDKFPVENISIFTKKNIIF